MSVMEVLYKKLSGKREFHEYQHSKRRTLLYVKKHKAIPVQAYSGPDVFRRLRLPDF
jgi:hypothetical protein